MSQSTFNIEAERSPAREVARNETEGPLPPDHDWVLQVLSDYSDSRSSRRRAMDELGLASDRYPDFVDLMERLDVPWPKLDRNQIEREAEFVAEASSEAMRTKLILPDSGPLFSFAAVDGGLELLLAAGLQIILTDYIEWEATRSGSPTARLIAGWIASHPDVISIVETERGQDRIAREKNGVVSKKQRRNVGEQTIFEALSEGDLGEGPFLFLFEEDKFVDPGFYGAYPVHSVTTLGFLVGLERCGRIDDADAVFRDMRSNGREGVKGAVVDRPFRPKREAADSTGVRDVDLTLARLDRRYYNALDQKIRRLDATMQRAIDQASDRSARRGSISVP